MLISFLLLHLQCAIAIDLIPQGVALGYGLYGLSARFSFLRYCASILMKFFVRKCNIIEFGT
ncbi:hypothetical protein C7Y71_011325 [Pseudoprevotella muciniphila]|uniref:Uncharacterized protein n=1 Tax=Pseudoprevotella muciniphila TaxID=2133944 RepID=A0A5P8E9B8_9BACT|nr:hypothetical protein C7Y71_011325 [Pseudoprevotella muciniphila]